MKINLHVLLLRYEGKPAERFFPFPLLESPCGECRTLFEGNIAANSSPRHDKEIDILSTLDRLFQRRPSLSWSDLKRILHFFRTEELQNFEQKINQDSATSLLGLLGVAAPGRSFNSGPLCRRTMRQKWQTTPFGESPRTNWSFSPELCSLLC